MSQTAERRATPTPTIHEVVVGFDGSPPAYEALTWAIDEATRRHTALRVVVATSAPRSTSSDAEVFYGSWMKDAAARAEDVLTRASLPSWRVDLDPGPASTILEASARAGALVVVGSTGHGSLRGAILGSVSQHLAEHATGPVVVCGRGDGQPDGPVVVGVDGSPESERALDFALARSEITGTPVRAVYGWRATYLHGAPLAGETSPELGQEYDDAERWLAEALAGRSDEDPDLVIDRELVPIAPAEALVNASYDASLVVVGTRGRGAIEGVLLGSVSRALLHGAHCPVAVVP